jgi:Flp pilus assembly pilin Flp
MSERISLAIMRVLSPLRKEDGQGAVEYALAVLAVAAVISVAMAGFTDQIKAFMTGAGGALQGFIP